MKERIKFFIIFCLMVLFVPYFLFAASSADVTVQLRVTGPDTIPPTVPTGLHGEAESSTISISWNPSTDYNGVAGYRLYRDDVFIATTSGNSYFDIGLTPNTEYKYYVSAFDDALNISAVSLPLYVISRSEVSQGGGGGIPAILPWGFDTSIPIVSVTGSGASVSFTSSVPVKYFVYIGETEQLEMGLIGSGGFALEHQISIPGLSPNKKYFYKIELFSDRNAQKTIGIKSFQTLPVVIPPTIPVSIEKLTFSSSENLVDIKWKPLEDTNSYVRIVRSYKFFPLDPYDGVPLYEGKGTSFFDSYKRETGIDYYYSVFVCNKDGICSFGQTFKAVVVSDTEKEPIKPKPPIVVSKKVPTIDNVKVFSNTKEVIEYKNNYYIDSSLPVKISLESTSSFGVIRAIVVSVSKTGETSQSYIAKYNEKRGIFETSPFYIKEISSYVVTTEIYDNNKQVSNGPEFVLNSITPNRVPIDYCATDWYSLFVCYEILIFEILFILATILLFYILYKDDI